MKKNKKSIDKIVSISATVLLILAICFCLFVVVQILGKGYVSLGKYSFFRIVTPSMEPNLSVGEVIVTKAVPIEEIEVEDVISFRSLSAEMFGTIITHRVVDIERDESGAKRLVTKGDANLSVDGIYVQESNFVGKVVWASGDSKLSSAISFLSGRNGFLALVVLPALLILSFILTSGIKTLKQNMNVLIETLEKTKKEQLTKEELSRDESYEELRQKIREELMEELGSSEDSQRSKTE